MLVFWGVGGSAGNGPGCIDGDFSDLRKATQLEETSVAATGDEVCRTTRTLAIVALISSAWCPSRALYHVRIRMRCKALDGLNPCR